MNEVQFDALAKLARLRPDSAGRAAARQVFLSGVTIYRAAVDHDIPHTTAKFSVEAIRKVIPLVHAAATGVLADAS